MTGLQAGSPFPKMDLPVVGGESITLGAPRGGHDWQLVVVYRGLHCPLCKRYLAQLDGMVDDFNALGVDVVALSGDGQAKAETMVADIGLTLTVAYGLSIAQMQALGLYISDPRSPQETDQPYPEPGLFVINDAGNIQILDISNAPFSRPDLSNILSGVKFIRENNYPVRGTHQTA